MNIYFKLFVLTLVISASALSVKAQQHTHQSTIKGIPVAPTIFPEMPKPRPDRD